MKRFIIIPTLLASLFIIKLNCSKVMVYAEETTETPTEEVVEEEQTLDEFKEEIKEWLSQYADTQLVEKILNWAIDGGVLTALFAVVLKYRKYKHTSIDDLVKKFKSDITDKLKDSFGDLSANEIKGITGKIGELEESLENVVKALVLMQDNSPEGRATLIDFLGKKNQDSAKVQEAVKEVKAIVEQEQEKLEEVASKVKGDYENIF